MNEQNLPATLEEVLAQVPATYDAESFAAVSKSSDFLPRVQLFGGNSDACKKGLIPIAHYGLVRGKEQIEDLGKDVDVLSVAWRPKAMSISDDGNVLTVFKPDNPEFKKIMARSELPNSGCMYGPEYLIWVPSRRVFGTFFMSSKTARREAPNMQALLKRPATLKAKYIETKSFSWHGPVVSICSTPFDLPDPGEMLEVVQKFVSPPETDVETVDKSATSRDR